MITWVQAALLGLMSCTAASIPAALGTTIGNYTLNRPLIASLFVGLTLGDVEGCIKLAIPMPIFVQYRISVSRLPMQQRNHRGLILAVRKHWDLPDPLVHW